MAGHPLVILDPRYLELNPAKDVRCLHRQGNSVTGFRAGTI